MTVFDTHIPYFNKYPIIHEFYILFIIRDGNQLKF